MCRVFCIAALFVITGYCSQGLAETGVVAYTKPGLNIQLQYKGPKTISLGETASLAFHFVSGSKQQAVQLELFKSEGLTVISSERSWILEGAEQTLQLTVVGSQAGRQRLLFRAQSETQQGPLNRILGASVLVEGPGVLQKATSASSAERSKLNAQGHKVHEFQAVERIY